ncbi:hypothetical protein [Roseateles sp.]|uniref:hypothetical protein n=1 Tax=Roseateles sp. TaxID=1971397 RepID=UPI002F40B9BF
MRTATCAQASCARNIALEISVDVTGKSDGDGAASGPERETTLNRGRWLCRHAMPLIVLIAFIAFIAFIALNVFGGVSGTDWLPVESLTIDRPPDVHRLLG